MLTALQVHYLRIIGNLYQYLTIYSMLIFMYVTFLMGKTQLRICMHQGEASYSSD